jgi:hypothetical protein
MWSSSGLMRTMGPVCTLLVSGKLKWILQPCSSQIDRTDSYSDVYSNVEETGPFSGPKEPATYHTFGACAVFQRWIVPCERCHRIFRTTVLPRLALGRGTWLKDESKVDGFLQWPDKQATHRRDLQLFAASSIQRVAPRSSDTTLPWASLFRRWWQ